MNTVNSIAFKEWAVVCAALAERRQTMILRKGGIHEGREGFRVEHREFWLFPTGFHQQRADVVEEAWPLLEQVQSGSGSDCVSVGLYAVVEEVVFIEELAKLARLSGCHIWSEQTTEQRFHYRSPGIFALIVRVHQLEMPAKVETTPYMAGCKSWVDLPSSLSTAGLMPVMDDVQFEQERQRILGAMKD